MPTLFAASMTSLDWTICIGYLLAVLALGIYFSREQHTNEDYFVGGRTMHWFPVGLSIFAGTFSSTSFVGLPRDAAYDDYHVFLGIMAIPLIVMPLVGWLFIPLYHRLQLTSVYEYLELRFDRPVRILASLLFMIYAILWMGSLLVAVGKILQVVLDLSDSQVMIGLVAVGLFATMYTVLGGVKAVVWTDALQAFSLGGGMLLVLILAVAKIDGGWATVFEVGNAHDKFDMFRMELDFGPEGTFFGACTFGFFVFLAGHAVHFTAVQRYVSMPTVSAARRSLAVNGIMVVATCLVFFLVGSTMYVYYEQINSPLMDQLLAADKDDQLLPHFVLNVIPALGLTGLLVAALFAAAMSSMDSGVNSLTALVVCDWLSGRKLSIWLSRGLTVVFGAVAVLTALYLFKQGGPVFKILLAISGSFLGLLLGLFLLGILSPRANTGGALIGLAAGVLSLVVADQMKMTFWWYGACTTLTTLFVGLFASLLFPAPSPKSLEGLGVGNPHVAADGGSNDVGS